MTGAISAETWRRDLAASLVVFMVALPLCLAIAKACNAPPEAGILAGLVGGLVVAPLSGSPLQVSGPAAGLIVLVLDFLSRRDRMAEEGLSPFTGLEALGVTLVLAGLMQLVGGVLRIGRWFRAVSPAVILGMLGGIGAVIVAKQVHVMVDDVPADGVIDNLLGIPRAIARGLVDSDAEAPHHRLAAAVGVLTLLVLVVWKSLMPRRLQFLPAALAAGALAAGVTWASGLPVQRITLQDNLLDGIHLPNRGQAALLLDGHVWQTAFALALIASAETLLCATAVDRLHGGPRTRYNRELAAQGIGNLVSGLIGALPVTGVIVRSAANVGAGARTRLSAVLHGVWLLAFVCLLPGVLRLISTSCLAAILVYTGVKLLDVAAVRALYRHGKAEAAVCAATFLGVVAVDLLTGVLLGIGLTVLKLAYTFSHLSVRRHDAADRPRTDLHLEGAATFIRLPDLAAALDAIDPGRTLHVHFDALSYIDHACLTLLMDWRQRHEASGGSLVIDWDQLHARFRPPRSRPVLLRPPA